MKKILKSKIFWIIVVLVGGSVAYTALKPAPAPEYTTEAAAVGELRQTVSVTGSVQGASEVNLNFEATGILAEKQVGKGDLVKAGDMLARLSAQSQYNAVLEAQANVKAADARLQKLVVGPSSEDIKVSQEGVNNAHISYQNKLTDLSNLKKKLSADEQTYRDAVASSQVSFTNARDNALNSVGNELFDGEAALNRVQEILESDAAKNTLGAKNTQTVPAAKNSRVTAVTAVAAAKQKLTSAQGSLLEIDVYAALASAIDALLKTADTLSLTYEVLVNTPAGNDYTQTEIDTDKANIRADQATISGSITALQTARTNFDNAKTAVTTAQNNLNTFLANQDSQIATAEGAVATAKGVWDLTQAQHQQLISPARSEDTDLQRAQLAQAQAALSRAQAALDQMTIYAPVDGTITRDNYEIGEKIDLTKSVFSLLGNSGLEIEVNIPESDIAKVTVGQPASITLDAFGDDRTFTGHVTFIDPAETLIQDVVYYKVKVTFDQNDADVKPGMTANIDIMTATKSDVLLVPARAVKENGGKYVEVLVNGQPVKKEVTTGLRGDGGLLEIVSGLSAGDQVITFTKEAK